MTHICRFLLTETRGRPAYYACHVCGALRPVHVPDVSTKPEQRVFLDKSDSTDTQLVTTSSATAESASVRERTEP